MIARRGAGLLALALLAGHAVAQPPVFRCGSERVRYQQSPCDDGAAVQVDDATSESRRREARAVAVSEARLAETLEKERQASEAQAMSREAGGFRTTAPLSARPGARAGRGDEKKKASKPRGKTQERSRASRFAVQD